MCRRMPVRGAGGGGQGAGGPQSAVPARVENFRDLRVWRAGIDLVECIYRLSKGFPADEIYGLRAQIRRAVVSIPSNIAEGHTRASTREYLKHLSIAQASLAEVETQLEIAVRLQFLSTEQIQPVLDAVHALGRQRYALRNALELKQ
jgi:four helix bundle protein